jgi:D-alanyl-lipoteichoic acid acyltransferase DltB (MBOAT superfamily)
MGLVAGSGTYFIFVAAFFLAYWAAPDSRALRLGIVLAANYVFCASFGLRYLLLIPACSTADYLIARALVRARGPGVRRALAGTSVAMNLGLLIASRHTGWVFTLGLSFYTLQSLTHTIDLYRGDADAAGSYLAYLSAAAFFPTLQAGPITRVGDLLRQFDRRRPLTRFEGGRAFFLIAQGLLKKALIADLLADHLVNRVFDTPKLYSGSEVLLAVYGYSLQLYFDFSGYTDIARGVAQLVGIQLPVNFDRPYLASNLTDFWRRWHLSFSNWLRDYLYFSLPGGRTRVMPYLNLVITMLLGGLWHGVTWSFVIWGLLHGCALAVTRLWRVWRGKPDPAAAWPRRALAVAGTYHFVCLTWIFFRAGSVGNALDVLERIGSLSMSFENVTALFAVTLLVAAAALCVQRRWSLALMERFAACPFYVHAAALGLVAVIIHRAGAGGSAPFVYSRF